LQSSTNRRQRCRGTSLGGSRSSREATPSTHTMQRWSVGHDARRVQPEWRGGQRVPCPAGHAPANPGPLGFKISVKAAVVVRVAHREPPAGPLRPPRPPAACLHVAQGASAGTSTPPAPPADPCVCQGETINENLIPQGLQPTSPKAHPVTPPDPLATLGALRR
jgi:hypothetical protein